MAAEVLQFVLDIFFGDVNVFRGSDAVNDQFGLDVLFCAVFLALAQADPIEIYGSWIYPLLCQRTHHAFQPHVFLVFHERFGNREVVALY